MTVGFRSLAIVNPRSAAGSTGRCWPDIYEALRAALGPFEYVFTQAQGEGTRLAAEALRRGVEMIVAIGGDGTVNEVVNGFFEPGGQLIRPDAVLGTIARGTGKDFIKTAEIPGELDAAARALAGRNTRPWDVGRVVLPGNGGPSAFKHFVNETDFGMGGEISRRVNASSKALGGFLTFLKATVVAMFHYKGRRVRLRVDGENLGEWLIDAVVVGIGRYCGGGMMLTPTAEPDDGLLDVVIVPRQGVLRALNSLPRLYDGRILEHPGVWHRRCRVFEAESDEEVFLGIDGESSLKLPARFEILARPIRVKVP